MQHVCQQCNTSFDSPHRKAKFCSKECTHKHRSIVQTADRSCELCGKELITPGQKKLGYCSIECRDSDPNRVVIGDEVHATCAHCGNAFTHPKWRNLKFCSKECADTSRKTITTVHAHCQQCGKEFAYRSHLNRKFCSRECWYTFGVGENNPQWDSVHVNCEHCGKPLKRQRYRIESAEHQFCNSQCRADWTAVRVCGESHYLWKGGADNNRGPNWFSQRRKAWKRDDYTCQHCGATKKKMGKNPDVHHIIPFREFGIERYKEANQIENLVCLCHSCHMKAEAGLIPIQPYLLSIP